MVKEGLYTTNQYNISYLARLSLLSEKIDLDRFVSRNKAVRILKGLGQLDDSYELFAVIGIFIIDCKNKETIFDECSLIQRPIKKDAYADIAYFIEDQSGKIQIHPDERFTADRLPIPGQVLGFLLEYTKRKIYLKDMLYPEQFSNTTNQTWENPPSRKKDNVNGRRICFIANPEINEEIETLKLIIMKVIEEKQPTDLVIIGKMCLNNTKDQFDLLITFLNSLYLQLHVIPNIGDPTNGLFPLNPIKKRIFNVNAQFYSNPTQFNITHDFQFIPEQSITSIKKYFPTRSTHDILKNIINGRITCPTAPDTIGCIPYESEPFYIEDSAQYVFTIDDDLTVTKKEEEEQSDQITGPNTSNFTGLKGVTCFTIPKYSRTKKIVFFDCQKQEIEGFELQYDQ